MFYCGSVLERNCALRKRAAKEGNTAEGQYGEWLRAVAGRGLKKANYRDQEQGDTNDHRVLGREKVRTQEQAGINLPGKTGEGEGMDDSREFSVRVGAESDKGKGAEVQVGAAQAGQGVEAVFSLQNEARPGDGFVAVRQEEEIRGDDVEGGKGMEAVQGLTPMIVDPFDSHLQCLL